MSDQISKLMTQIVQLEAERDIARKQAAQAETARQAWETRGEKAEADAAALWEILNAIDQDWFTARTDRAFRRAFVVWRPIIARTPHPGAALLAELEAARAVVRMARSGFGTNEDIILGYAFDPTALRAAISAYDAAVKAREM